MKQGNIRKADAKRSHGVGTVCGVIEETEERGIDWQDGDWAMGCDFPGNDLTSVQIPGERCSAACVGKPGCTHYHWSSSNGGTCWMKKGSMDKSKAVKSRDGGSVCGLVS
jgi:hypothetical protein